MCTENCFSVPFALGQPRLVIRQTFCVGTLRHRAAARRSRSASSRSGTRVYLTSSSRVLSPPSTPCGGDSTAPSPEAAAAWGDHIRLGPCPAPSTCSENVPFLSPLEGEAAAHRETESIPQEGRDPDHWGRETPSPPSSGPTSTACCLDGSLCPGQKLSTLLSQGGKRGRETGTGTTPRGWPPCPNNSHSRVPPLYLPFQTIMCKRRPATPDHALGRRRQHLKAGVSFLPGWGTGVRCQRFV